MLLSAAVASEVFSRAVNNSGMIRAGGIQKVGGKVMLTGLGAGVTNTGTIDASGTRGGEVSVTSDTVVRQLGTVAADGGSGDGGRVTLEAVTETVAGDGSETRARSASGRGGSVALLASGEVSTSTHE